MPPTGPTAEDFTKQGYFTGEGGTRYNLGSQEATDYLLTRKPVSVLSTDNAVDKVDKSYNSLNELSPTTAPGYVSSITETRAELPKAYFTNEAGQEAEYTEAQLRDPKTQEFITNGGYVMTKTEGPSLSGGQAYVLDTKLDKVLNDITNYNVDEDPGFRAQAESLRATYEDLRTEVEKANKQRAGALATAGIRGGTSRYGREIQLGIEGEELNQAAERISDIARQEASAISAARSAYRSGKFAEFNTQVTALQNLRTNKQKELEELNKKLAESIKKVQETTIQASRDSAIAGLVAQGITDASQILNYLNYDEQGNQTGDFTAEQVKDTLEALSPGGDLKNLTGTVREFYSLLGQGAIPTSITNLPEEQQFFAYLNLKKRSTTIPGSSGAGGTISLTDARSAGLPMSVVGMTENQIISDLQKLNPPQWFEEKYAAEQGDPEKKLETWEAYRLRVYQTEDEEGGGGLY